MFNNVSGPSKTGVIFEVTPWVMSVRAIWSSD